MRMFIINVQSPEYRQVLYLRNEVLRKPLGLILSEKDIENDSNEWILIAKKNEDVVASVQLRLLSDRQIKLRQMVVDVNFQSKGYGRRLLQFAEQTAREKSYDSIVLHARTSAIGFYQKAGYQIVSKEFMEVGIPHYKMEKQL